MVSKKLVLVCHIHVWCVQHAMWFFSLKKKELMNNKYMLDHEHNLKPAE